MKPGMCVHYNGIFGVGVSGTCRAGVNYRELAGGERSGYATRLPCTDMEAKGGEKVTCAQLRHPTPEELVEDKRQSDEHLRKFMVAYTGKVAEWRAANKWDRNNRKAAAGSVPCEVCGTGTIHLSMAAYNGHVHGQCTTAGCISWME